MKHDTNKIICKYILSAIVLIACIPIVSAIPPTPESYWGYTTLNGAPVPDGTSITVEVYGTGEEVGNTTVQYPDGGYSLDIIFNDPDTPEDEGANEGDALTWKINGINCSIPAPGTDTATPGGTNSNFNLTVTITAVFSIDMDFVVETYSDNLNSGLYDGYFWYDLEIYNEDDDSDAVLGDLNFSAQADNITDIDWEEYAFLNNNYVNWTFSSEFIIEEDDWFSTGFGTDYSEQKFFNANIDRWMNQTLFSNSGYQLANFSVTFENTDFEWCWVYINVEADEQSGVDASIVPGTFTYNAPGDFEEWEYGVFFEFDMDLIQPGVTYNFSGVVEVNLTGDDTTPVLYKPEFYIGEGLYYDFTTGGTGYAAEIPQEMLPDHVSHASASTNVSNTWLLERYDHVIAVLGRDTTAPVITNITNTTPTTDSVTITWDTDEDSNSLVRYGTTSGIYTNNESDAAMVTSHSITLTGLSTDTTYYFVVNSTDASGNSNESDEYSFKTAAITDTAPPIVNSVIINNTTPYAGDDILVTVNATDNVGVVSVEANNVALTHQGGNIWNGTIIALEGTHFVNVSASDAASNIAWNNFTSYTAIPVNNTPVGTNVEVAFVEEGVNLTFANVTESGQTSVEVSSTGPSPPTEFDLLDNYYDITTTAHYTDNITVCINYNDSEVDDESALSLFHYESVGDESFTYMQTNISKGDTVWSLTGTSYPSVLFGYKERLNFVIDGPRLEINGTGDNFVYDTSIYSSYYWLGARVQNIIGWLGEPFFVVENGPVWYISKLLTNEGEDDDHLLKLGDSLNLPEGFAITPVEIDIDGEGARFSITKNGEEVCNSTVNEKEMFQYMEDLNGSGFKDNWVLRFNVETVFAGMNTNLVKFNAIQLRSPDVIKIETPDTNIIPGFKITSDNNDNTLEVRLENVDDSIKLEKGGTVNLLSDRFRFKLDEDGDVGGILDPSSVTETWVDVTSSLDTDTNIICAIVTDLSEFIIAEQVISDTSPPVVNSVTINNTTPYAGEDILVTVNATDNVGVVSVEANNVALTHQGGDIWNGTITAILGNHWVSVMATDAAGLIGWNSSATYSARIANNTPVGTDVQVEIPEINATITFANISKSGQTFVSALNADPSPPAGLNILGDYYDIVTTAKYSGDISVCIEYNDSEAVDENNLKILHYEEMEDKTEIFAYVQENISIGDTVWNLNAATYPDVLYEGSMESLHFVVDGSELEINYPNFTYATSIYDKDGEPFIAWLDEPFFVVDNFSDWYLAKILLDETQDDTHLLVVGNTMNLVDGFAIVPLEIDVEGKEVWISITKDGEEVVSYVVDEGGQFTYREDLNESGVKDNWVLRFNLDMIITGVDYDLINISGLKLISPDILKIETPNDSFISGFEITSQNNDNTLQIRLDSPDDKIVLEKGGVVNLIGDKFRFKIDEDGDVGGVLKRPSVIGLWKDVTSSLDTDTNIICGVVTNLSDFVIAEPIDTTSPVITNITNTTPTTDSVTITWDTDEDSDSLVKYGTASGTYTDNESDTAMVTSHSITLTGLSPDTTYYFLVNSTDTSGNSNESGEYSFRTAAVPDTTPPIITNIANTTPTINSVTLIWDTDEDSDSLVQYGTASGTHTDNESDTAMVTSHSITLTGLSPDTTYYFVVNSTDASSNSNQSGEYSFRTASAADTSLPIIISVTLSTTTPHPGDDILVTVNSTDNIEVINVEANGIALTYQGGNIWNGTIIAIEGTNFVNVSASDGEGNIVWNNSSTYTAIPEDSQPPIFPMILYGSVTIDEEPAHDVTIIAKIDGEVRGSSNVNNGKYGEYAWDRLIVNGNPEDEDKIVRFYLESIPSDETTTWHSGDFIQLDLSFNTPIQQTISETTDNGRRKIPAGSTGEKTENILLTEINRQYVYKGSYVNFEFNKPDNAVTYVKFLGLVTAGKVPVTVEMISDKCSLAPSPPPDRLYCYAGVCVGGNGWACDKTITNSHIGFGVKKSWIEAEKIDISTITMYRCEGNKWTQLDTMQIDEDDDYVYFDSATPGFSLFAITGKRIEEKEARAGGEGIIETISPEKESKTPGISGFSIILSICCLLILAYIYREK